MPLFPCPYCHEVNIHVSKRMICQCRAEMRSVQVDDIEETTLIDKDTSLYLGSGGEKLLLPPALVLKPPLYVIYSVNGMQRSSPLLVCGESDYYFQPHPQLETPFTRFFVKGLLYSGIGNAILFAFLHPPILVFWISLFAWAGIYYYFSRKIKAKKVPKNDFS
jgi:hypothetical protein